MRDESAKDLAIILLVWVAVVALINPIGDFPLNDDWSYARPVLSLVHDGKLELLDWPTMTLITHVLWGALVSLLFGSSFTTLRISTLGLAVLALFAFHKTLREVGASRSIALWSTLLLAVNPLFVNLANTFMTDVPFLAVAIVSTLFFIRALKNSRRSDLWIATIFSILATLIRQLGIFIPIAFAAACIYRNRSFKRTPLFVYAPTLAAMASLAAYQIGLQQMHGLPASLEDSTRLVVHKLVTEPPVVLGRLLRTGTKATFYLGVFLLPFVLLFSRKLIDFRHRESLFSSAGFLGLTGFLAGCVLVSGKLMPMLPDILYNLGLGPATLRDIYLLELPHLPRAPQGFWLAVTIAGILGGSAALTLAAGTIWRSLRKKTDVEARTKGTIALFIAAIGVLYFVPLSLLGFRDRYLLFCLPLLMLVIVNGNSANEKNESRCLKGFAAGLLILVGIFAVGGTHDYLSWNRARWEALRELTEERGIPPSQIDGGFEFNGWYCYDSHYSENAHKSWWWVKQDDFVIAFGPIAGFEVEKRYDYDRWIPPVRSDILLLRKLSAEDCTPALNEQGNRLRED